MSAASVKEQTACLHRGATDMPTSRDLAEFRGLELIASENLTSLAVMECNGSCELMRFC